MKKILEKFLRKELIYGILGGVFGVMVARFMAPEPTPCEKACATAANTVKAAKVISGILGD